MKYQSCTFSSHNVNVEYSSFGDTGHTIEHHFMFHVEGEELNYESQLQNIINAYRKLSKEKQFKKAKPVFARCFLTDASNQREKAIEKLSPVLNCEISYVKQPLLDGSKIALWVNLLSGVETGNDGLQYYENNGYRHYYASGSCDEEDAANQSAYTQTYHLLESYEEKLHERGCTIEHNCMRTWFFVRDVDVNYADIVRARKDNFFLNGLKPDTHFIASTGIEGSSDNPHVKVLLDTYAVKGLDKGQVNYLYARKYLSPTYDYGVTFERGVMIDYGDRRNVYISGTASINNKGTIVHAGNIEKQILRMWRNVEALLKEADCTFEDLMQVIVYLRDIADFQTVKKMFDEKFHQTPKLIVLAPICRPGWLVEMECIAAKRRNNPKYRDL